MTMTVADHIAAFLRDRQVELVFGICGHTNIALLAALERGGGPRFITTRHEQVAAHAADGYARASGRPGVVVLHVGPGLTNATTGVATAVARLRAHDRDRRGRPLVLREPGPAPGAQSLSRCRPDERVRTVREARVASHSGGPGAAGPGSCVGPGSGGPPGSGPHLGADGHPGRAHRWADRPSVAPPADRSRPWAGRGHRAPTRARRTTVAPGRRWDSPGDGGCPPTCRERTGARQPHADGLWRPPARP